jgi:hypothetical protein
MFRLNMKHVIDILKHTNTLAASIDLQLTQWSARFNPFGGSESPEGDEEGCGNTTDGTSCLESTDVFTFTLRHKGAEVSALHVRLEKILC